MENSFLAFITAVFLPLFNSFNFSVMLNRLVFLSIALQFLAGVLWDWWWGSGQETSNVKFSGYIFTSLDDFFDDNNDRRFCIKCHTARGIKPYVKRGTPAKDYWLPIGWCRFGGKLVEKDANFSAAHCTVASKQTFLFKKVLTSFEQLSDVYRLNWPIGRDNCHFRSPPFLHFD